MLDRELTRILDIKEETDQKLIEAYKRIAEFEQFKNKITILLVFILISYYNNVLNTMLITFRSNKKVKTK